MLTQSNTAERFLCLLLATCLIEFCAAIGNFTNNQVEQPTNGTNVEAKIIGGSQAYSGQFPYIVRLSIVSTSGTTRLCGGTIVSSYYVVTAAGCFSGITVQSGIVIAGNIYYSSTSSTQQSSYMASYKIHSLYSTTTQVDDLAIVTLSSPFTFNSYVAALPLPSSSATFYSGQYCTVAGWGYTYVASQGNGNPSTTLMYTSLSIVDLTTCANSGWSYLTYQQMCTSSSGQSICFGDGGGPVICSGTSRGGSTTQVFAGIMSYNDGTCADGTPTVNTLISCYSDAIYSYINGNGLPSSTSCSSSYVPSTCSAPTLIANSYSSCSGQSSFSSGIGCNIYCNSGYHWSGDTSSVKIAYITIYCKKGTWGTIPYSCVSSASLIKASGIFLLIMLLMAIGFEKFYSA